jgi:hypothetical protein
VIGIKIIIERDKESIPPRTSKYEYDEDHDEEEEI